jgi:hypothetical protein
MCQVKMSGTVHGGLPVRARPPTFPLGHGHHVSEAVVREPGRNLEQARGHAGAGVLVDVLALADGVGCEFPPCRPGQPAERAVHDAGQYAQQLHG